MRAKKITLIIAAAVFAVMLGAIIFLAVRMNIEHSAYLKAATELEDAERNIQGLNDQLLDAHKTIAEYEGVEFDGNIDNSSAGNSTLGGLSIADIAAYDISDELTIKLAADPEVTEDHYVKVGVTLSLNTTDKDYDTYSATLATNEGIIKDTINKVIGEYTYTKIQSMQVSEVQNDILKELKKMYDSEFIAGVSFGSWYIQ